MKASARLRPRGFWRGLMTGIGLAAAAVVGLALAFPPVRFFAPQVTPATQSAPLPPSAPAAGGDFARPRAAALPGDAAAVASLARVGIERAPDAGLLPVTGPGADAQRPPVAPMAPGETTAAPGRPPPAARRLLPPAAGAPLVTVSREKTPDLRAVVASPPAPAVGAGTPSLVPPAQ